MHFPYSFIPAQSTHYGNMPLLTPKAYYYFIDLTIRVLQLDRTSNTLALLFQLANSLLTFRY